MQLLSHADIIQVSAGKRPSNQEVLSSMEHYSFFFAFLGGTASGIYGLCTNHTVATVSGMNVTFEGSFINVFLTGLAVSWVVGAAVGGVAAYTANENN